MLDAEGENIHDTADNLFQARREITFNNVYLGWNDSTYDSNPCFCLMTLSSVLTAEGAAASPRPVTTLVVTLIVCIDVRNRKTFII